MIELPDDAIPNGMQPSLLDFGTTLRPSTGAEVGRINRKGSRYRLQVSLPPMTYADARICVSRLLRAKSDGLRIPFTLLEGQGSPGSPVVDGAGQEGAVLEIRGLNPGYAIREGYWLSIEDENGRHYLHNCGSNVRVAADGLAQIALAEHLRWPFLDGATIHLAVPMVEGFVDGQEWSWVVPVNKLIALEFPLEEAA